MLEASFMSPMPTATGSAASGDSGTRWLLKRHLKVFTGRRGDEFEERRLTRASIRLLERDIWENRETLAGAQRDRGLVGSFDCQGTCEYIEGSEATEPVCSGGSERGQRDLTEDLRVGHLRRRLKGNVIAFKHGPRDFVDERLTSSRTWPDCDRVPRAWISWSGVEMGVCHALVELRLPGHQVQRRHAVEYQPVHASLDINDAGDMLL